VNRISILVATHVVALLVLAAALWNVVSRGPEDGETLAIAYMATGFSQCGLLALWLALGQSTWKQRASTSLLGAVCLWLVSAFAYKTWRASQLMMLSGIIFGCIASLAGVLYVASRRKSGFRLVRQGAESLPSATVQFSLRHLFLFTVVVSIALAGGTLMKLLLGKVGEIAGLALICSVIIACFLGAVLAVLWASLGQGRLPLRLAVAFALATAAGLIPPFYLQVRLRYYAITLGLTTLAQAITIFSLLVVRSAGYRLVRRDAPQTEADALPALVAHPLD
jgi:hypothetical protein